MVTEKEKRVLTIGESVKDTLGPSNDLDLIVGALKANGLMKIESMFVLSRLFNVPLQQAKPYVHSSRHWSEEKENDEKLAETLLQDNVVVHFPEKKNS